MKVVYAMLILFFCAICGCVLASLVFTKFLKISKMRKVCALGATIILGLSFIAFMSICFSLPNSIEQDVKVVEHQIVEVTNKHVVLDNGVLLPISAEYVHFEEPTQEINNVVISMHTTKRARWLIPLYHDKLEHFVYAPNSTFAK